MPRRVFARTLFRMLLAHCGEDAAGQLGSHVRLLRGKTSEEKKGQLLGKPPLILAAHHHTATTNITTIATERFVLFWKQLGARVSRM